MNVGRLAARAVVGGLFVGHGTQKLFGWFDGPGFEGTKGMMESLELRPAERNAYAAGITETAGGALLIAGLATPLACAGLIGTMVTAIRKVHSPELWNAQGGYEYNAVLIATLMLLAEEGPGDISADAALGWTKPGVKWSMGALALGAAASIATVEAGRRAQPEPDVEDSAPPVDTAGDPTTQA